ncbi:flagellar filament capping protein FliD [Hydrogenovibrio sp. JE_KL2]|uniref:flagellar filament capping protein FliD n=1 Tax=Hydrogenovibrio sp. JE_KL2 TaxID=2651188 RepID=UPI00128E3DC4|nr:flagellar filament capping protein FliD [Hydrogenovibrio sp. JE_KL2]MPQ76265.1 flagellar filament capping protein FliD [Hydrogenovibrio sp. JE_KL2]
MTTSTTPTNSELGASILNSLGLNKFDVTTMSKTLATASVAAQRANLDSENTKYTTEKNGYDTLQQALQGFSSQISALTDFSNFQQKSVVSSDSSVVDATVTGAPANSTYQIEVQNLATAQTLATQTAFSSANTAIGQGTLSLTVGGSTTNITIDSTNDTLTGIRDAVNSAGLGVTASVINVGTGYKLVFASSQTGASNQITIGVSGDTDGNNTDASGLSQLVNANMNETVPAQDATFVLNGLTITNASNNIAGVIDGVTLNLKGADLGQTKTLQISSDTSKLDQNISDFVDLYNSLDNILGTLGSYDAPPTDANGDPVQGDQTGALKGDPALRDIKNQIRQAMIDSIPGLSGSIQSMADIGITSNLDGTLSLDKAKLSDALATSPDAVGKLFAASANATDNLVTYKGSTTDTVEGTYNLTVNVAAAQASITGGSTGGGNITIDNTNNTLQVSVDGTSSSTLTLAAGTYTPNDLATAIATAINNDGAVKSGGSSVSVQYDSATQAFTINTDKYGSTSTLSLDSGTLLTSGVTGLAVTSQVTGQDVQGSLEQNGTFYTFLGKGQDVTINSILAGSPKGLEFTVDGSQTGARGTLTFNRGYADKLTKLFADMTDSSTGLIGTRLSNIQEKLDNIKEQQTKVDDRYNQILTRYQTQFGALQALLNQLDNTKQSLSNSLASLLSSGSKK